MLTTNTYPLNFCKRTFSKRLLWTRYHTACVLVSLKLSQSRTTKRRLSPYIQPYGFRNSTYKRSNCRSYLPHQVAILLLSVTHFLFCMHGRARLWRLFTAGKYSFHVVPLLVLGKVRLSSFRLFRLRCRVSRPSRVQLEAGRDVGNPDPLHSQWTLAQYFCFAKHITLQ